MARIRTRPVQNTLSGGEFSPEYDGRLDQQRYFTGAARIENFVIRPIGGVRRRVGWRYVVKTADQAHRAQLIAFVPRANLGYVLEFTDQKVRFHRNNGQVQNTTQLIVNGAFPVDTAGWTLITTGSGTAGWNSGYGGGMFLQTFGAAGLATGSQVVAVVPGAPNQLSWQIQGLGISDPATGIATVEIGSTPGASDLGSMKIPADGIVTATITSPTATLSLLFKASSPNFHSVGFTVDNVSVVGGAVPLEFSTPYLAADLVKIRWAQSADVLYLACEGYAPRKLSRVSDLVWVLSLINFRPPPTEEKTVSPAADLTLGALTGTAITFTASVGVFLAGDVDREIKAGVGRAVITGFTSVTQVTVDILDDFTASPVTSGNWTLGGTPGTTITLNKKEPQGAQVTITAALACFRSTDVGKYIHVYNGIAKITKFTSTTVVVGAILARFENTTATSAWTLESESWNATDGYPVDVGFSQENRLVWARDDRIWGSVQGDYENMSVTTLDDDGIEFGLRGSAEVPQARGLIGANELQVFSSSNEFTLTGGNDSPITPTNIRVKSDTNEGSARVRPLRVNGVSLFVGKSGRSIFEFVFSFEPSRFVAPNLSLLAPHLFPQGTQIIEMAYQRTPDSTLWVVRSDGLLLGLAYQRDQNVVGWHKHTTQGGTGNVDFARSAAVESVAVIPHPDGDREQVWLSVRRTINGATVRTMEYMDDASLFIDVNGLSYGQANLDACLLYNGPATAVVTGLSHLEGASVMAIGNGAVAGTFTVSGGQITLPTAASLIEVGLPYVSTLTTVRPEIQTQEGTIQGRPKRQARVFVRLYQAAGLSINGHPVNFRLATDDATRPVPLYSGDVPRGSQRGVLNLGWDRDGRITITQEQPLPCTVVLVASLMGVGG